MTTHLNNISNSELILRMEKLVRSERKITHLILQHISEIEDRKIYAELGYDGMYSYLTRGLGYSEGGAYRRLQSARLLKQHPSVAQKIEEGSLNLTQLTQVQKCLKESFKKENSISEEKTQEILHQLENKNSWETQKTLAIEMDLPVVQTEKILPQKDETVRLEITLTPEQFAELEQAKSLLSHILPEGSWTEVLATLAKVYNQKKLHGRTKLTQSVIAREPKSVSNNQVNSIPTKNTQKKPARKYISIHHKRALRKNAKNCCEYQSPLTGLQCSSRYQLEIDHRHPLALGGGHELSNLRILCKKHNLFSAETKGLKR